MAQLPKARPWKPWLGWLLTFVFLGVLLYFVAPQLPGEVVRWAVFALAMLAGVYLGWLEPSKTDGWVFPWLRKVVGVGCIVLGVVAVTFVEETAPSAIAWHVYDPSLLQKAGVEGQPVILDFYADWCPPCRKMESVTYQDKRVAEALKPFVMVKVDMTDQDAAQSRRLATTYRLEGLPTLVFLDRQGKELPEARVIGYRSPDALLQHVREVLRAAEARSR